MHNGAFYMSVHLQRVHAVLPEQSAQLCLLALPVAKLYSSYCFRAVLHSMKQYKQGINSYESWHGNVVMKLCKHV